MFNYKIAYTAYRVCTTATIMCLSVNALQAQQVQEQQTTTATPIPNMVVAPATAMQTPSTLDVSIVSPNNHINSDKKTQNNNNSIVDIQAINTQNITPKYSNMGNFGASINKNSKTLFKMKEGNTQITESKEYGHSQRDIHVNGNIGSYDLSKPMNGSITDEKTQRNTSVRVFNF